MNASVAHADYYAALPSMDQGKLVELRSVVGDEELRAMLDLLPVDGRRAIEAIEAARAASDLGRARRTAHGLKGLVGNFGAQRIEAVARDIEMEINALDELDRFLPILASAIEDMRIGIASAS